MPPRRGRPVEFRLSDPASATAILADVARAVAEGVVTPEEGEKIGAIARTRMEAIELGDITRTLRRMEMGREWGGSGLEENPSIEGNGRDRHT
jgi:hypothetical protein